MQFSLNFLKNVKKIPNALPIVFSAPTDYRYGPGERLFATSISKKKGA